MISLAEQLADAVADRLRCDPLFWEEPAVAVRSLQRKERLSEINVAFVKSTVGAFVAVSEMPVAQDSRRSANLFATAKVDVFLVDNRTLNKTSKSAELLAEAAASALACYTPAICEQALRVESIEEASTGEDVDQNRRVLRVRCSAAAANPYQPEQTAAPIITLIDEQAVIVAAAGATIRYTLDESRPTTGSPVYAAPVPLSAGQTITARAWAAGERASLVATCEG